MSMPAFLRQPTGLLTEADLHHYQRTAIQHQCTVPFTNLWLDMGLGKTIVTLTSIATLQRKGFLGSVLVVAPLTVVETVWEQQAREWDHTRHLKFRKLTGSQGNRLSQLMAGKPDIYLINYDNLQWLGNTLHQYFIGRGKPPPFNGVVWDEISKMKRSTTKRVRSARRWLPYMKWRTGLTGTPAGNGYMDLHGQYLVLDGGTRLGTSITAYRDRWFYKEGYRYHLFNDSEEKIHDLIADITIEMSEQEYRRLPPMITNNVYVYLQGSLRKQYDDLEQQMFVELDSGFEKEVFNAAAKTNSCLQFANGAVYREPGALDWEHVHDLKLEALSRVIDESPGQPLLVGYAYKSDAERIMKRFKDLHPVNLTDTKDKLKAIEDWKAGNIQLMLGHPASMGHGVDGLQRRGHIAVWFGPNWSLELYKQFNARLRRQGQGEPVVCHRILAKDTLDEAVIDAIAAKNTTEQGLRSAIRSYRNRRQAPPGV